MDKIHTLHIKRAPVEKREWVWSFIVPISLALAVRACAIATWIHFGNKL